MRIRRLPRAIRDVDEIWDWIAAEDIEAADRLSKRIAGALTSIHIEIDVGFDY